VGCGASQAVPDLEALERARLAAERAAEEERQRLLAQIAAKERERAEIHTFCGKFSRFLARHAVYKVEKARIDALKREEDDRIASLARKYAIEAAFEAEQRRVRMLPWQHALDWITPMLLRRADEATLHPDLDSTDGIKWAITPRDVQVLARTSTFVSSVPPLSNDDAEFDENNPAYAKPLLPEDQSTNSEMPESAVGADLLVTEPDKAETVVNAGGERLTAIARKDSSSVTVFSNTRFKSTLEQGRVVTVSVTDEIASEAAQLYSTPSLKFPNSVAEKVDSVTLETLFRIPLPLILHRCSFLLRRALTSSEIMALSSHLIHLDASISRDTQNSCMQMKLMAWESKLKALDGSVVNDLQRVYDFYKMKFPSISPVCLDLWSEFLIHQRTLNEAETQQRADSPHSTPLSSRVDSPGLRSAQSCVSIPVPFCEVTISQRALKLFTYLECSIPAMEELEYDNLIRELMTIAVLSANQVNDPRRSDVLSQTMIERARLLAAEASVSSMGTALAAFLRRHAQHLGATTTNVGGTVATSARRTGGDVPRLASLPSRAELTASPTNSMSFGSAGEPSVPSPRRKVAHKRYISRADSPVRALTYGSFQESSTSGMRESESSNGGEIPQRLVDILSGSISPAQESAVGHTSGASIMDMGDAISLFESRLAAHEHIQGPKVHTDVRLRLIEHELRHIDRILARHLSVDFDASTYLQGLGSGMGMHTNVAGLPPQLIAQLEWWRWWGDEVITFVVQDPVLQSQQSGSVSSPQFWKTHLPRFGPTCGRLAPLLADTLTPSDEFVSLQAIGKLVKDYTIPSSMAYLAALARGGLLNAPLAVQHVDHVETPHDLGLSAVKESRFALAAMLDTCRDILREIAAVAVSRNGTLTESMSFDAWEHGMHAVLVVVATLTRREESKLAPLLSALPTQQHAFNFRIYTDSFSSASRINPITQGGDLNGLRIEKRHPPTLSLAQHRSFRPRSPDVPFHMMHTMHSFEGVPLHELPEQSSMPFQARSFPQPLQLDRLPTVLPEREEDGSQNRQSSLSQRMLGDGSDHELMLRKSQGIEASLENPLSVESPASCSSYASAMSVHNWSGSHLQSMDASVTAYGYDSIAYASSAARLTASIDDSIDEVRPELQMMAYVLSYYDPFNPPDYALPQTSITADSMYERVLDQCSVCAASPGLPLPICNFATALPAPYEILRKKEFIRLLSAISLPLFACHEDLLATPTLWCGDQPYEQRSTRIRFGPLVSHIEDSEGGGMPHQYITPAMSSAPAGLGNTDFLTEGDQSDNSVEGDNAYSIRAYIAAKSDAISRLRVILQFKTRYSSSFSTQPSGDLEPRSLGCRVIHLFGSHGSGRSSLMRKLAWHPSARMQYHRVVLSSGLCISLRDMNSSAVLPTNPILWLSALRNVLESRNGQPFGSSSEARLYFHRFWSQPLLILLDDVEFPFECLHDSNHMKQMWNSPELELWRYFYKTLMYTVFPPSTTVVISVRVGSQIVASHSNLLANTLRMLEQSRLDCVVDVAEVPDPAVVAQAEPSQPNLTTPPVPLARKGSIIDRATEALQRRASQMAKPAPQKLSMSAAPSHSISSQSSEAPAMMTKFVGRSKHDASKQGGHEPAESSVPHSPLGRALQKLRYEELLRAIVEAAAEFVHGCMQLQLSHGTSHKPADRSAIQGPFTVDPGLPLKQLYVALTSVGSKLRTSTNAEREAFQWLDFLDDTPLRNQGLTLDDSASLAFRLKLKSKVKDKIISELHSQVLATDVSRVPAPVHASAQRLQRALLAADIALSRITVYQRPLSICLDLSRGLDTSEAIKLALNSARYATYAAASPAVALTSLMHLQKEGTSQFSIPVLSKHITDLCRQLGIVRRPLTLVELMYSNQDNAKSQYAALLPVLSVLTEVSDASHILAQTLRETSPSSAVFLRLLRRVLLKFTDGYDGGAYSSLEDDLRDDLLTLPLRAGLTPGELVAATLRLTRQDLYDEALKKCATCTEEDTDSPMHSSPRANAPRSFDIEMILRNARKLRVLSSMWTNVQNGMKSIVIDDQLTKDYARTEKLISIMLRALHPRFVKQEISLPVASIVAASPNEKVIPIEEYLVRNSRHAPARFNGSFVRLPLDHSGDCALAMYQEDLVEVDESMCKLLNALESSAVLDVAEICTNASLALWSYVYAWDQLSLAAARLTPAPLHPTESKASEDMLVDSPKAAMGSLVFVTNCHVAPSGAYHSSMSDHIRTNWGIMQLQHACENSNETHADILEGRLRRILCDPVCIRQLVLSALYRGDRLLWQFLAHAQLCIVKANTWPKSEMPQGLWLTWLRTLFLAGVVTCALSLEELNLQANNMSKETILLQRVGVFSIPNMLSSDPSHYEHSWQQFISLLRALAAEQGLIHLVEDVLLRQMDSTGRHDSTNVIRRTLQRYLERLAPRLGIPATTQTQAAQTAGESKTVSVSPTSPHATELQWVSKLSRALSHQYVSVLAALVPEQLRAQRSRSTSPELEVVISNELRGMLFNAGFGLGMVANFNSPLVAAKLAMIVARVQGQSSLMNLIADSLSQQSGARGSLTSALAPYLMQEFARTFMMRLNQPKPLFASPAKWINPYYPTAFRRYHASPIIGLKPLRLSPALKRALGEQLLATSHVRPQLVVTWAFREPKLCLWDARLGRLLRVFYPHEILTHSAREHNAIAGFCELPLDMVYSGDDTEQGGVCPCDDIRSKLFSPSQLAKRTPHRQFVHPVLTWSTAGEVLLWDLAGAVQDARLIELETVVEPEKRDATDSDANGRLQAHTSGETEDDDFKIGMHDNFEARPIMRSVWNWKDYGIARATQRGQVFSTHVLAVLVEPLPQELSSSGPLVKQVQVLGDGSRRIVVWTADNTIRIFSIPLCVPLRPPDYSVSAPRASALAFPRQPPSQARRLRPSIVFTEMHVPPVTFALELARSLYHQVNELCAKIDQDGPIDGSKVSVRKILLNAENAAKAATFNSLTHVVPLTNGTAASPLMKPLRELWTASTELMQQLNEHSAAEASSNQLYQSRCAVHTWRDRLRLRKRAMMALEMPIRENSPIGVHVRYLLTCGRDRRVAVLDIGQRHGLAFEESHAFACSKKRLVSSTEEVSTAKDVDPQFEVHAMPRPFIDMSTLGHKDHTHRDSDRSSNAMCIPRICLLGGLAVSDKKKLDESWGLQRLPPGFGPHPGAKSAVQLLLNRSCKASLKKLLSVIDNQNNGSGAYASTSGESSSNALSLNGLPAAVSAVPRKLPAVRRKSHANLGLNLPGSLQHASEGSILSLEMLGNELKAFESTPTCIEILESERGGMSDRSLRLDVLPPWPRVLLNNMPPGVVPHAADLVFTLDELKGHRAELSDLLSAPIRRSTHDSLSHISALLCRELLKKQPRYAHAATEEHLVLLNGSELGYVVIQPALLFRNALSITRTVVGKQAGLEDIVLPTEGRMLAARWFKTYPYVLQCSPQVVRFIGSHEPRRKKAGPQSNTSQTLPLFTIRGVHCIRGNTRSSPHSQRLPHSSTELRDWEQMIHHAQEEISLRIGPDREDVEPGVIHPILQRVQRKEMWIASRVKLKKAMSLGMRTPGHYGDESEEEAERQHHESGHEMDFAPANLFHLVRNPEHGATSGRASFRLQRRSVSRRTHSPPRGKAEVEVDSGNVGARGSMDAQHAHMDPASLRVEEVMAQLMLTTLDSVYDRCNHRPNGFLEYSFPVALLNTKRGAHDHKDPLSSEVLDPQLRMQLFDGIAAPPRDVSPTSADVESIPIATTERGPQREVMLATLKKASPWIRAASRANAAAPTLALRHILNSYDAFDGRVITYDHAGQLQLWDLALLPSCLFASPLDLISPSTSEAARIDHTSLLAHVRAEQKKQTLLNILMQIQQRQYQRRYVDNDPMQETYSDLVNQSHFDSLAPTEPIAFDLDILALADPYCGIYLPACQVEMRGDENIASSTVDAQSIPTLWANSPRNPSSPRKAVTNANRPWLTPIALLLLKAPILDITSTALGEVLLVTTAPGTYSSDGKLRTDGRIQTLHCLDLSEFASQRAQMLATERSSIAHECLLRMPRSAVPTSYLTHRMRSVYSGPSCCHIEFSTKADTRQPPGVSEQSPTDGKKSPYGGTSEYDNPSELAAVTLVRPARRANLILAHSSLGADPSMDAESMINLAHYEAISTEELWALSFLRLDNTTKVPIVTIQSMAKSAKTSVQTAVKSNSPLNSKVIDVAVSSLFQGPFYSPGRSGWEFLMVLTGLLKDLGILVGNQTPLDLVNDFGDDDDDDEEQEENDGEDEQQPPALHTARSEIKVEDELVLENLGRADGRHFDVLRITRQDPGSSSDDRNCSLFPIALSGPGIRPHGGYFTPSINLGITSLVLVFTEPKSKVNSTANDRKAFSEPGPFQELQEFFVPVWAKLAQLIDHITLRAPSLCANLLQASFVLPEVARLPHSIAHDTSDDNTEGRGKQSLSALSTLFSYLDRVSLIAHPVMPHRCFRIRVAALQSLLPEDADETSRQALLTALGTLNQQTRAEPSGSSSVSSTSKTFKPITTPACDHEEASASTKSARIVELLGPNSVRSATTPGGVVQPHQVVLWDLAPALGEIWARVCLRGSNRLPNHKSIIETYVPKNSPTRHSSLLPTELVEPHAIHILDSITSHAHSLKAAETKHLSRDSLLWRGLTHIARFVELFCLLPRLVLPSAQLCAVKTFLDQLRDDDDHALDAWERACAGQAASTDIGGESVYWDPEELADHAEAELYCVAEELVLHCLEVTSVRGSKVTSSYHSDVPLLPLLLGPASLSPSTDAERSHSHPMTALNDARRNLAAAAATTTFENQWMLHFRAQLHAHIHLLNLNKVKEPISDALETWLKFGMLSQPVLRVPLPDKSVQAPELGPKVEADDETTILLRPTPCGDLLALPQIETVVLASLEHGRRMYNHIQALPQRSGSYVINRAIGTPTSDISQPSLLETLLFHKAGAPETMGALVKTHQVRLFINEVVIPALFTFSNPEVAHALASMAHINTLQERRLNPACEDTDASEELVRTAFESILTAKLDERQVQSNGPTSKALDSSIQECILLPLVRHLQFALRELCGMLSCATTFQQLYEYEHQIYTYNHSLYELAQRYPKSALCARLTKPARGVVRRALVACMFEAASKSVPVMLIPWINSVTNHEVKLGPLTKSTHVTELSEALSTTQSPIVQSILDGRIQMETPSGWSALANALLAHSEWMNPCVYQSPLRQLSAPVLRMSSLTYPSSGQDSSSLSIDGAISEVGSNQDRHVGGADPAVHPDNHSGTFDSNHIDHVLALANNSLVFLKSLL